MDEVIAGHGDWAAREAFLAGPSARSGYTAAYLDPRHAAGPSHIEDFGWGES